MTFDDQRGHNLAFFGTRLEHVSNVSNVSIFLGNTKATYNYKRYFGGDVTFQAAVTGSRTILLLQPKIAFRLNNNLGIVIDKNVGIWTKHIYIYTHVFKRLIAKGA